MERRELKRDKEVGGGGHGSAEKWMEREKHREVGQIA